MDRQKFVFERVAALSAVAQGKPGHRTFYLVVGDGQSWVRIWLEKEHLESLSVAIAEMLETIAEAVHDRSQEHEDQVPEILYEPANEPAADFRLNQLAVGYDEAQDRIGLFVYAPDTATDSPTLVCWVTRPEARTLGDKIEEICASGRPICQLCGGPMDPEGHVCPKSNGHNTAIL